MGYRLRSLSWGTLSPAIPHRTTLVHCEIQCMILALRAPVRAHSFRSSQERSRDAEK
jgi:hypothetical protein